MVRCGGRSGESRRYIIYTVRPTIKRQLPFLYNNALNNAPMERIRMAIETAAHTNFKKNIHNLAQIKKLSGIFEDLG